MTNDSMTFKDWPALFETLRTRPGMWMGGKSVSRLQAFRAGVCTAEELHHVPTERRLGGLDFDAFRRYVEARTFENSGGTFWTALKVSGSEEAGFDLWFEWLDAFLAQRS